MASEKEDREGDRYEKKILLASKYVAGLIDVLKKLLAAKNTDNQ